MFINSTYTPEEVSFLDWEIQKEFNTRAARQLAASNFQDIFSLTRRIGDIEVKMNKIKFRSQGIGGMLGIAAGSLGGPLGSIIGFGIGRSIGSMVGNGMARRYYGEEQMVINEHLFMARQRDTQIKFMIGQLKGAGSLVRTMRQNRITDDKKVLQDMMVL